MKNKKANIEKEEEKENLANPEKCEANSLICYLCLNFMYKCVTAFCGHSFCEQCLDEYLILKKVYISFLNFLYSNVLYVTRI